MKIKEERFYDLIDLKYIGLINLADNRFSAVKFVRNSYSVIVPYTTRDIIICKNGIYFKPTLLDMYYFKELKKLYNKGYIE